MDQALDLVTDQNGFSYVTGFFSGEVHFGDLVLESQGKADVFVVKYNWSGESMWVKRAGGNQLDYGYGISMDNNDALYLCGNFQEEDAFGEHVVEGVGGMDMFVAKLLIDGDGIPENLGETILISPNPNDGHFEVIIPSSNKALTICIDSHVDLFLLVHLLGRTQRRTPVSFLKKPEHPPCHPSFDMHEIDRWGWYRLPEPFLPPGSG